MADVKILQISSGVTKELATTDRATIGGLFSSGTLTIEGTAASLPNGTNLTGSTGSVLSGFDSIEGITSANLVDKSAAETVTGLWTHQSTADGISLIAKASASLSANGIVFQVQDSAGSNLMSIDKEGDMIVAGAQTFTGGTTFNGNITFGDAVTDTVTFTARVATGTDFIPIADSSSSLGTTALRFLGGFIDKVTTEEIEDTLGSLVIDSINAAANSTVSILNSDASFVCDVDVDGSITAGTGVTVTTGGLTVTAGGALVTAGGLDVDAGGLTVGNDAASQAANSIFGNVTVGSTTNNYTTTLWGATDVKTGGLTVTAGGLTVTAGAVDLTGGSTIDVPGGTNFKIDGTALTVSLTSALMDEMLTFFGATNMTGAEAETLTDGSNADALHVHAVANAVDLKTSWTASGAIGAGEGVRANGNDTATLAIASSEANAKGYIGVGESAISDTASGDITYAGVIGSMQFETSLTLAAGEPVYLSASTSGAHTNVAPSTTGQVVLEVGIIKDASAYVGTLTSNSLAEVLLQVKKPIVIA